MRRNKSNISLPWERKTHFFRLRSFRWRWLLLAVLCAVIAIAFIKDGIGRQARRETQVAIDLTKRAVQDFRRDIGRCPNSMVELLHPPLVGARYLAQTPRDAWGQALRIRCPGHFDPQSIDVISAGPSGSFLNNDNIR